MTHYTFELEGGDAEKEACAALASAITGTWRGDQRRIWKDILLTILVRRHVVGPMQRACCQSIALGQEPRQQDDTQHAWPRHKRHEMLAKDGGYVGRCLHD